MVERIPEKGRQYTYRYSIPFFSRCFVLNIQGRQVVIPQCNQSGVLPPFTSEQGPTDPAGMSPYRATITEFVCHYASSPERIDILKGLLEYRRELRNIGISTGFQWLDGSFVEDVELTQHRPPNDVDIVTFAMRPTTDLEEWKKIFQDNLSLFDTKKLKENYMCDAYFVDLNSHPIYIVNSTKYWFGLFSHQRETSLWKGMVEIDINCSDEHALDILEQGVGNA